MAVELQCHGSPFSYDDLRNMIYFSDGDFEFALSPGISLHDVAKMGSEMRALLLLGDYLLSPALRV